MPRVSIHRRYIRPAILGATLASVLAASPAGAAVNNGPIILPDNPTCASINPSWQEIKIDKGTSGNESNAEITVTDTVTGTSVDWTSTIGVDAVIVKGGDNAHVYTYDPEALSGTGLTPPINPNTNQPFGVSHVSFCYDLDVPVDPGPDPDPKPDPDPDPKPDPDPQPNPDPTPDPKIDIPSIDVPDIPQIQVDFKPVEPVVNTAESRSTPRSAKAKAGVKRTSARLRAPSTCVKRTFTASVVGKNIKSVRFFADGRRVAANGPGKFAVRLAANKDVRHLRAKVTFVAGGRQQSKTLNVAAIRCLQRAVSPRFTG